VATAMTELGIPGVGLALLDGGQLVYAGASASRRSVDPIRSTAIRCSSPPPTPSADHAAARQAGRRRQAALGQPVAEIYPDFRLGDAATTRQVLVRHLVCACTGLPRQDFEWLFNFAGATPASSLACSRPCSRPADSAKCSSTATRWRPPPGSSAAHWSRRTGARRCYDAAMRQRIFDPLGMTRTTFDFARALADNHASPHDEDPDGTPTVARMDMNYSIVPVRPAGGMWTSARELARYLTLELADGALPDGRRLVSAASLRERRKPQIQIGEDASYGMGLVINTRYGHSGDQPRRRHVGYKSVMVFLPEHGVGAVVLTTRTRVLAHRSVRAPAARGAVRRQAGAAEQVKVGAAQRKANRAKWRERLVIPPTRTMPRSSPPRTRTRHSAGSRCAPRTARSCSISARGTARSPRAATTTARRPSSRSIRRSTASTSWSAPRTASAR